MFGGGYGETVYRSLLLQEYSKVAAKQWRRRHRRRRAARNPARAGEEIMAMTTADAPSGEELLDVMTRLTDVLAEETALLRTGLRRRDRAAAEQEDRALRALCRGDQGGRARRRPGRRRCRSRCASSFRRAVAASPRSRRRTPRPCASAARPPGCLLEMVIELVEAQRRPTSGYTANLTPARAPLLAVALDRRL